MEYEKSKSLRALLNLSGLILVLGGALLGASKVIILIGGFAALLSLIIYALVKPTTRRRR